jgi:hypothetical protein
VARPTYVFRLCCCYAFHDHSQHKRAFHATAKWAAQDPLVLQGWDSRVTALSPCLPLCRYRTRQRTLPCMKPTSNRRRRRLRMKQPTIRHMSILASRSWMSTTAEPTSIRPTLWRYSYILTTGSHSLRQSGRYASLTRLWQSLTTYTLPRRRSMVGRHRYCWQR